MGILYTLTLSSLGVYGILFSGWSANSTIIALNYSIIRVELIRRIG
jgi:NADH:ubiquinone oxidoreductase subunit H